MFALGISSAAQEPSDSTTSTTRPALVTDRPDVAESAVTVGSGTVQMETGVSYSREAGVGAVSFPTLLRFGVTQAWELRVESDMVALRNPGLSTGSDVTLGAKLGLHDGEQSAVALLFGLNVPAGPRDLRGTVDPSVSLLWDQSLLGELGLAVNLGVELTGEQHDRFARWSWAAALAHPVSERLSSYVEIFGDGPDVAGGRYQLAVDGGLLYLLNPDTQFDIAYARGLSAGGFDWSLGLGFSRRF